MDDNFSLKAFEADLDKLIESFNKSLQKISVGRANPAMLDDVFVDINETKLALKQVATVLVQEATTLKVTPFDNSHINVIYEAIRNNQNLNLNPTDDGRSIYIPIPPMTHERRQQVVKTLQSYKEDSIIRLRQYRHQVLKQIKEADLSQDRVNKLNKEVDVLNVQTKDKLEQATQQKTDDILKI